MNARCAIEQMVEEGTADGELLFADGYDDCIIGVNDARTCVIYDQQGIIKKLMADGMDFIDAREYFDFNIGGAYVGPHTPIYCDADLAG